MIRMEELVQYPLVDLTRTGARILSTALSDRLVSGSFCVQSSRNLSVSIDIGGKKRRRVSDPGL